jgi:hypothetical protein
LKAASNFPISSIQVDGIPITAENREKYRKILNESRNRVLEPEHVAIIAQPGHQDHPAYTRMLPSRMKALRAAKTKKNELQKQLKAGVQR